MPHTSRSTTADDRRHAIVEAAFEVFIRHGYDAGTIARVADAAGLTTSGVMHYFASKQELYIAVLEHRQSSWRAQRERFADGASVLLDGVGLNERQPGLVRLFATLQAQAIESDSAARDFFVDHQRSLVDLVEAGIIARRGRGELPAHTDARSLARVLVALSDGLQVHWLLDPDTPLAADFEHLLSLLSPEAVRGPRTAEEAP